MILNRSADPDEAAAIAAAIERFRADTAPVEVAEGEAIPAWQRAALIEGVEGWGEVQRHLEGGEKWQS